MTPDVTVHFQDEDWGNMPTTLRGDAEVLPGGRLLVAGRAVPAHLITNVHEGACDHAADQRSDAARANFERKYR